MADKRTILVTGATGKQGGAVINAILADPSARDRFTILGVTRDSSSKSAQSLASKSPAIKLVQGNLNDCPALFRTAREVNSLPIWGVYSVQAIDGKDDEEKQGKALIDAALDAGVQHFVYSSVDRGGDEKSWTNPTNIPHFITKHNIELYLREKSAGKMTWTILRPVAFMDNWHPGFGQKIFATALKQALPANKPLQWIACQDIGFVGAQAFINPQKYAGKAVGLASDELTFGQTVEVFRKVTGQPLGTTFGFVGSAFLWAIDDMGKMCKWFGTDGYGIDIAAFRKQYPQSISFEDWLATKSAFPKK